MRADFAGRQILPVVVEDADARLADGTLPALPGLRSASCGAITVM
jgi:hypothetical protein